MIKISGQEYDVEMVRRDLWDLFSKGEIDEKTYEAALLELRDNRPLTSVNDLLVQALGGVCYDPAHPFGGLPEIPEGERRQPGAFSETCYICRDPDYAAYGLPLCRACPSCGGHIPADDDICDDCGLSDRWFWDVERELVTWDEEKARDALSHCFEDTNYEKVNPSDDQLDAAVAALRRVYDERG
jgi:hypothetical protein